MCLNTFESMGLFGEGNTRVAAGVIACSLVTLAVVIISIAAIIDGYHEIKEGHAGVYFKFGALQDIVKEPGNLLLAPPGVS